MRFINKPYLTFNLTDSVIKVNVNMFWSNIPKCSSSPFSNHDYEIGTETEISHFNKQLESQ